MGTTISLLNTSFTNTIKMAVKVVRKAKRVTKKMQTGTMRRVWNGTCLYTKGGLMKKDLCLNKSGKVVSKKKFQNGKKAVRGIKGWLKASVLARKQLGLTGFVACKKGTKYYNLTKQLYGK